MPDDFVFVPKHKSNAYYVAEDPGARLGVTAGALRQAPGGGGGWAAAAAGADEEGGVEG